MGPMLTCSVSSFTSPSSIRLQCGAKGCAYIAVDNCSKQLQHALGGNVHAQQGHSMRFF